MSVFFLFASNKYHELVVRWTFLLQILKTRRPVLYSDNNRMGPTIPYPVNFKVKRPSGGQKRQVGLAPWSWHWGVPSAVAVFRQSTGLARLLWGWGPMFLRHHLWARFKTKADLAAEFFFQMSQVFQQRSWNHAEQRTIKWRCLCFGDLHSLLFPPVTSTVFRDLNVRWFARQCFTFII